MTPRGLAGASQSYKERRDLYKMKSSGKVRESVTAANPIEEKGPSISASVNSYSDIISRIEQNMGAVAST